MLQFSPFRTAIIAIVAVLGIFFTLPNLVSKDVLANFPDWLPKQQIVLGLDLQGGSHLLLQVNREDIVTERVKEVRRDARSILANDNGIGNIITTADDNLTIELTDPTRLQDAKTALETLQNTVTGSVFAGTGAQELSFGETADGKITIALTDEGIEARMSSLVSQSIEVIRRRIDELGTTEPTIQRQGQDRVLVQVPGFDDSNRLKDIISQTARLTFHMVYPGMSAAQAQAQGLPSGTMILPSQDGADELIYEDVALGGESLVDAQPGFDQQTSQAIVTFRFDTRGSITFGEITSNNVGRRFAIVLDNQVITAPVIQSAITGGTGQIQGSFTPASANDLAVLLRAGALPATLDIIEERSVGPSLGADSVSAGLLAGMVGAAAVIIFMVIAYGTFGIFANISLILNVTLILGALSMLGATLTLPGIAGIVLTVGMAVDANVLIYERIREEMTGGRTVYQAIEAGFQRAMATIIDANVTTLIAAVILFFLGSGPIQGFAVTLALGILTTMFSAYLVTLFIIGRWYSWVRPKTLKLQLFRFVPDNTSVPFIAWRKIAITFSVVAGLASVGLFATQGLNLGIDFKGGSSIEVQAQNGAADIGDIRSRLNTLGLGDVQVQGFGTPEDVLIRIETQPGGDTAQQDAVNKVSEALGSDEYEIRRTESVGPTVSGELALAGTIAVLAALGAVLVYIWFRFEWQFAVGAIIATFHDVVLTIGLYSLIGLEFNLTSIAAILTIVGYSLNDTVVVYDRVRETLRKFRKMPIADLLNLSINATLSRTTLTSFTTILALLSLVIFGGEVIRGFTLSMTWGIIVGTYSSIFIAAPILLFLGLKTREEVVVKEEKRADGAAV
ncbi:protein translocase subunit SecD [Mariluticola halotolerans]|uniref:protein translocase subunit SecD n=1 Tax=Mariluticola halotolerans TaxID=2909283 RepID=UPI0026E3DC87|nr:protein translocase subunit SecD [Mariluticola halotolerans]UJQ95059.1 protein translocase subunit SecD [Mariluticola halotolerans]